MDRAENPVERVRQGIEDQFSSLPSAHSLGGVDQIEVAIGLEKGKIRIKYKI